MVIERAIAISILFTQLVICSGYCCLCDYPLHFTTSTHYYFYSFIKYFIVRPLNIYYFASKSLQTMNNY